MLQAKKIFTIKRAVIFFALIFVILFFAGKCSTLFIDPQIYYAYYLCSKNAKQNIYDKTLYDNLKKRDGYIGKEIIPEDLRYLPYMLHTKIIKTEIVTNRITKKWYKQYFNRELVAEGVDYDFFTFKLWIIGDEAAGFHIDTKLQMSCKKNNLFVSKEIE